MRFQDVVNLISVSEVDNGNNVFALTETSRTVFAHKKSVTRSEFYKAIANNLKPTIVFVAWDAEYNGEQKLQHENIDYLIIRSYNSGDRMIELVCQAFDDIQSNLAKLRDTIEIWHNVLAENSMGEKEPAPERLYTLPAHITFDSGGTGEMDGITETTNNITVTIRYRSGITPDMFLMVNGQRYDIRFIEDPFNRHEALILHAERMVP
jgi:SPP1 family predicted phage head-tail adaptor